MARIVKTKNVFGKSTQKNAEAERKKNPIKLEMNGMKIEWNDLVLSIKGGSKSMQYVSLETYGL